MGRLKISVREGHPNNWPRKIARKHANLRDALNALDDLVDEGNCRFAWSEFTAERERLAKRAEGARIRRELLAEISMLFSRESTIVEDDLRAILDRVIPEER